ncbi:hypothetical protein BDW74DRAFT_46450 [Aspergillus multicolor]|uniref:uncharacterized protein n=1 Tax=Aspergillus multicolor TaxID=41759 RepID=UPI003CCE4483
MNQQERHGQSSLVRVWKAPWRRRVNCCLRKQTSTCPTKKIEEFPVPAPWKGQCVIVQRLAWPGRYNYQCPLRVLWHLTCFSCLALGLCWFNSRRLSVSINNVGTLRGFLNQW